MAEQKNLLPLSIVAGESIAVTITGVSVTSTTLVYQFSAPVPVSVACTVSGATWLLNVTPAQTLTFKFGNIRFAALLTNTITNVTTCVDSGVIAVAASPLALSQYSAALVAVEAAIAAYGTTPNKRLSLSGMSIEYRDLDELIQLREYYKAEVRKETGGIGSGAYFIRTRF